MCPVRNVTYVSGRSQSVSDGRFLRRGKLCPLLCPIGFGNGLCDGVEGRPFCVHTNVAVMLDHLPAEVAGDCHSCPSRRGNSCSMKCSSGFCSGFSSPARPSSIMVSMSITFTLLKEWGSRAVTQTPPTRGRMLMLACLTVQESTKVIGRKWEKVGKCARGSNSVTGTAQPQAQSPTSSRQAWKPRRAFLQV